MVTWGQLRYSLRFNSNKICKKNCYYERLLRRETLKDWTQPFTTSEKYILVLYFNYCSVFLNIKRLVGLELNHVFVLSNKL